MSECKDIEKENPNSPDVNEPDAGIASESAGEKESEVKISGKKESQPDVEVLTKSLTEKEKELAELKDLMQRRQADFENYKKRCTRQEETNKRMLIRDIALDVIQINDNLERASAAAATIPEGKSLEDAHKSYVEGVVIISKSIDAMLGKYGITAVDSLNQSFDPNVHEAVEINTSEEVQSDLVTKVYQKGFKMDDFILRTSKVCVTRPQPPSVKTDQKSAE